MTTTEYYSYHQRNDLLGFSYCYTFHCYMFRPKAAHLQASMWHKNDIKIAHEFPFLILISEFLYVTYWPEDDQPLVEICNYFIYINKNLINSYAEVSLYWIVVSYTQWDVCCKNRSRHKLLPLRQFFLIPNRTSNYQFQNVMFHLLLGSVPLQSDQYLVMYTFLKHLHNAQNHELHIWLN